MDATTPTPTTMNANQFLKSFFGSDHQKYQRFCDQLASYSDPMPLGNYPEYFTIRIGPTSAPEDLRVRTARFDGKFWRILLRPSAGFLTEGPDMVVDLTIADPDVVKTYVSYIEANSKSVRGHIMQGKATEDDFLMAARVYCFAGQIMDLFMQSVVVQEMAVMCKFAEYKYAQGGSYFIKNRLPAYWPLIIPSVEVIRLIYDNTADDSDHARNFLVDFFADGKNKEHAPQLLVAAEIPRAFSVRLAQKLAAPLPLPKQEVHVPDGQLTPSRRAMQMMLAAMDEEDEDSRQNDIFFRKIDEEHRKREESERRMLAERDAGA